MVILKGTHTYTDTGLQEYSNLEVMQMLGRAGRPQFETEACAVILCLNDRLAKYEKMVAGEEVLESSLHQNLIEHLNAEIGIGTISNLETAKQWLSSTFLNIRLQRNPAYYNLDSEESERTTDDTLLKLCENGLHLLHEANMINDTGMFRCTEYGDAMARYCIKFDTMKTFIAAPAKAKGSAVLNTLSQAAEFRDYRLKAGERGLLKMLNQANQIRYPIKVNIDLPQHKVSLLIQARLGAVQIGGDNKNQITPGQKRQIEMDTNGVIGHGKRLIRCIVDIFVHRNDSFAAKNALELGRSLAAGVWDDTVMQLKQIPGIGDVSVRKLAAAGIKSIDTVVNTEPHRLEVVLSKNPPYGHDLLKRLADFPMLHITAKEFDKKLKPQKGAEVKLQCHVGFLNDLVPIRFGRKNYNVLFLCETSYGELVEFRRFAPSFLKNTEAILLTALVDRPGSKILCHIMCDDIVGTHKFAEVEVICPASWFPAKPPNERTHEVSFQSPRMSSHAPTPRREEFDGGLDDSDLFAALAHEPMPTNEEIEVIEDIDVIMEEMKKDKNVKESRKRRKQDDTSGRESREPRQLPNGNWMCQHTCFDEGKECKHKCCRDGKVTRPKKPAKKRQKKDQALDGRRATNKAKEDKNSSVKRASQEGPLDRILPKVNLGGKEEIGKAGARKASIEPQSGTGRGKDSLTQERAMAELITAPGLQHPPNQQPVACKDFDSGDYDWQAMDDIAGLFSEPADPLQPSCAVDSSLLRHHSFPSLEQHQVFRKQHDNAGNELGWPGKSLVLTASSTSFERGDIHGFEEDLYCVRPSDDPAVGSSYQTPGHRRQSANASSFRSLASSLVNSSATLTAHPQDRSDRFSTTDSLMNNDSLLGETEYERTKRLCDEDQKRRWAELDDNYLNYENFGKWFKIIDDPEEKPGDETKQAGTS